MHSLKVLVKIRTEELEFPVVADGVYFPATGTMHLEGQHLPEFSNYANSSPLMTRDFLSSPAEMMNVSIWELVPPMQGYWYDDYCDPPLSSSTRKDCAISATLQYPPLSCRWNTDRVLKYSFRSNRATDDPLYFAPLERSVFFPYRRRHFESEDAIQWQRRAVTRGRSLRLVLGLVCIALQIKHGRNNEESLPFVSPVMLGIQLANHLSQTTVLKDLQIGEYRAGLARAYNLTGRHNSISEHNYYGTMPWSEHWWTLRPLSVKVTSQ